MVVGCFLGTFLRTPRTLFAPKRKELPLRRAPFFGVACCCRLCLVLFPVATVCSANPELVAFGVLPCLPRGREFTVPGVIRIGKPGLEDPSRAYTIKNSFHYFRPPFRLSIIAGTYQQRKVPMRQRTMNMWSLCRMAAISGREMSIILFSCSR